MAKQERSRKSAPQNKVKSFNLSSEPIFPSSGLNAAELVCFEAVIASRERDTWLAADVRVATTLAQAEYERDCLRDRYMADLDADEAPARMPILFRMHASKCNEINQYRRELGITASQRGIAGHKQAKRNQQDASSTAQVSSMSALISRPNVAS